MAEISDDWTSEEVWRKANPALGKGLSLEYMRAKCQKAKDDPGFENTFKRLHLNISTEQDKRWLQLSKWDACQVESLPPGLESLDSYLGLDLSSTTDLSALVLAIKLEDERVAIREWFFAPEESAYNRQKHDKVPYLDWAARGYLTLTPGNVVDYSYIEKVILELNQTYKIKSIGYDPYMASELSSRLLNVHGLPLVEIRQGTWILNDPSMRLEKLVVGNDLLHLDNPVMRWCASNVAIKKDGEGRIRPHKGKSNGRIDGISALVNALAVMQAGTLTPENPVASYLEKEDLIFI